MLKKLIFCWGLLLCSVFAFAQDFPDRPNSLVGDFAGIFTPEQKKELEDKLNEFDRTTSTQIAVVTMRSTGSYDINEYTALLGRRWGVGTKEHNNGIVLLVAVDDRKVSIQTGYGAEGAVPDGVTHDIIEKDILPYFRDDNYYGGIKAGSDQLMKYMKGEYKADQKTTKARKQGSRGGSASVIIIIVIFILILVFRNRGGGGGQIIGSRGGASPFWWFLAGSALGRSSGGGGWGGFSGGGGSSGGGFGGFGGGSFGGGGSSGSW